MDEGTCAGDNSSRRSRQGQGGSNPRQKRVIFLETLMPLKLSRGVRVWVAAALLVPPIVNQIDAVISAALVPAFVHFLVMLGLMTVALPFVEGGPGANRGTWMTAGSSAAAR